MQNHLTLQIQQDGNIISRASFGCTKKLKKLHIFLTKVAIMP